MRSLRVTVAAAAALLALAPAAATAETLAEALRDAYASNPRLAAAQAELAAFREELAEARGGFRPNIGVIAGSTYNDINSSVASENFLTSRAGLQLRQNLYAGGGTLADIRRAENLIAGQEARLINAEQEVLLDTVTVYSALLRDQRVLDASVANVERLEEQLRGTRNRFSVGEATRTDAAQAQARLSGAFADRSQAAANLAAAIAAYARVVGNRPQSLEPAPLPDALPPDLEAAVALAETNPELRAAAARFAEAEAEVDVAFARFLPSVDLEGELSYIDEPSIFTEWERDASIGVEVTIPLYQQGIVGARLRQARQIAEQRRRELQETRRGIVQDITRNFEDLRGAESRVRFHQEQVEAYEQALDGVEQEALIGNRSIIDVLDAEQDLFGAQVALERAVRDRTVAAYGLKAAIGEMGLGSLGLPAAPAEVSLLEQSGAE